MIIVKSETSRATAAQLKSKLTLVAEKLSGNATFPAPPIAHAALSEQAALIQGKLDAIAVHDQTGQRLTLELRYLRDTGARMIGLDASYVQTTVNQIAGSDETRAAAVLGAGYEVVDRSVPVGAMPKIENVRVAPGEVDGTFAAGWDPVARGLNAYVIEIAEDAAGQPVWQHAGVTKKSTLTLTGLTSARRYSVRVAAVGAAGQGPWSDTATKVAP